MNVKTVKELQDEWKNPYLQWWAAGMPTFETYDISPWKQLTIYFETMEDRKAFSDLFDYNMTEKTNVVWYPAKLPEKNITTKIVEEV